MSEPKPLILARRLFKTYVQRRPLSRKKFVTDALNGVELSIHAGSSFGLIGESGSGKSTLAFCLARLEQPTSGEIWFDGRALFSLRGSDLMEVRGQIQLIFQDSAAALSPRMDAEDLIVEPLRIHGIGTQAERRGRAAHLMERVGLSPVWLKRHPYQFSGGQRQRLAIARALALQPRFLILDEAFAGLDLSVQAQIIGLLRALQNADGLTYMFISHDLSLLSAICDRIAVMHHGQVVEQGNARELFAAPRHRQTQALLEAIPGRRSALRIS